MRPFGAGEPFRADGRNGPAQTPIQSPYDWHLDEVYLIILGKEVARGGYQEKDALVPGLIPGLTGRLIS
jgi:hypothetical protein